MSAPRAVLFDIDGTLLDAGGAGRRALNAAFAAAWGMEDACQGVNFAGATDPELVREIMEHKLGLTMSGEVPVQVKSVLAAYLRELPGALATSRDYRVLVGAHELLKVLAKRRELVVALATGNIPPAARLKLAKARMNTYFRTGGYGGDAPTRAGIVAVALERVAKVCGARVERGRSLLIGDTERDVKAARATGLVAVGVNADAMVRERLAAAGAQLVVTDLATGADEILALL